jgi:hypothetical protein
VSVSGDNDVARLGRTSRKDAMRKKRGLRRRRACDAPPVGSGA